MALPPPMRSEMGAFYLVFGPMELSAGLGYTTPLPCNPLGSSLSFLSEYPFFIVAGAVELWVTLRVT